MDSAKTPYTALYSLALRAELVRMPDDALRVFLALCSYCDGRGVCFPGARLLASVCDLSIQAVNAALELLQRDGQIVCIRKDQHDVTTNQQLPNVYKISPNLLKSSAVFDGLEQSGEDSITKKPDRYYASAPIRNQNHYPESEATTESSARNQPPQPAIESKPSAFGAVQALGSGSDRAPGAATDYAKEGTGHKQGEGQPQRAARPGSTSQSDESTLFRRREPRDLRRYAVALADDFSEQLALDLVKAAADLSLPNARMLVDVYPRSTIVFARQLFWEQAPGRVRSPARWLRKVIRRVDAQPEEAGAAS